MLHWWLLTKPISRWSNDQRIFFLGITLRLFILNFFSNQSYNILFVEGHRYHCKHYFMMANFYFGTAILISLANNLFILPQLFQVYRCNFKLFVWTRYAWNEVSQGLFWVWAQPLNEGCYNVIYERIASSSALLSLAELIPRMIPGI